MRMKKLFKKLHLVPLLELSAETWNSPTLLHQKHIRNICLAIKASIQRIYPYS